MKAHTHPTLREKARLHTSTPMHQHASCYHYSIHMYITMFQELDRTLPIMKPSFQDCSPGQGVHVTWIGHATLLIQMDGINIITDPIFSSRCAPFQAFGPKRYRGPPCTVAELPQIHLVLISHTHYDHLDYHSVKQLNARFGSELQWCVPMGLGPWMQSMDCHNLIELDWWEERCMAGHNIKIVCTPCQHWCKRTATDDNKVCLTKKIQNCEKILVYKMNRLKYRN